MPKCSSSIAILRSITAATAAYGCWLTNIAVPFRDLVFEDECGPGNIPGELADRAVILVGVVAPVGKNDVRIDAPLQVLEPVLDFASLVGEKAVLELAEFECGSRRPCQKCSCGCIRLVARSPIGAQHAPMDFELRPDGNELENRAARPLRCHPNARPNKGVKVHLPGVQDPVPSFSRPARNVAADTGAAPPRASRLAPPDLPGSAGRGQRIHRAPETIMLVGHQLVGLGSGRLNGSSTNSSPGRI